MAEICVVLVAPKQECNVGFVARAMKNFGLTKLFFCGNDFLPGEKAYECAAHAKDVLHNSVHLKDRPLNEIFDVIIGTTAKPILKESSPRNSVTPEELVERMRNISGRAAILFGREDTGLSNKELDLCDLIVYIPAHRDYRTLNISHAAAILFYVISKETDSKEGEIREADGLEKKALLNRLGVLLDSIGYPNYKKRIALRIFRKVMGRAGISGREAHTLAGIFKEADDEIKRRVRRD